MNSFVLFERFTQDPFLTSNPFDILRSSAAADSTQLTNQASELQFLALTEQVSEGLRDALCELSASPWQRLEWELLTPHDPCLQVERDLTPLTNALGQFLFGGDEPVAECQTGLERFVLFLKWDAKWKGSNPPTLAELQSWWQIATHRQKDEWRFRHHLALLYQRQAMVREREMLSSESNCSRGQFTAVAPTHRLAALWRQADRCWAETLRDGRLWDEIRRHLSDQAGYQAGLFDDCREQFPRRLIDLKLARIEHAIRGRNRLGVARQTRWLAALAQDDSANPLCDEARRGLDRLPNRLWSAVRQREEDHPAQLEELLAGLMIVAPRADDVLKQAFAALVAQGNVEQATQAETGTTPWERSLPMARALTHYGMALCQDVFVGFPSTSSFSPNVRPWQKQGLQWLFGLLIEEADQLPPVKRQLYFEICDRFEQHKAVTETP